jgi:hypothetical protein
LLDASFGQFEASCVDRGDPGIPSCFLGLAMEFDGEHMFQAKAGKARAKREAAAASTSFTEDAKRKYSAKFTHCAAVSRWINEHLPDFSVVTIENKRSDNGHRVRDEVAYILFPDDSGKLHHVSPCQKASIRLTNK